MFFHGKHYNRKSFHQKNKLPKPSAKEKFVILNNIRYDSILHFNLCTYCRILIFFIIRVSLAADSMRRCLEISNSSNMTYNSCTDGTSIILESAPRLPGKLFLFTYFHSILQRISQMLAASDEPFFLAANLH